MCNKRDKEEKQKELLNKILEKLIDNFGKDHNIKIYNKITRWRTNDEEHIGIIIVINNNCYNKMIKKIIKKKILNEKNIGDLTISFLPADEIIKGMISISFRV